MSAINVNIQDTFETWRTKTNEIGAFIGDTSLLETTEQTVVDGMNEIRSTLKPISDMIEATPNTTFKISVDTSDTFELTLDAVGNLQVTGQMTATQFNGPLVGNVTGNLTGNVTGNVTGDLTGNASGTASRLATARSISITGDATWTTSFDGSGNVTSALTLANSGITAGTYTKITFDSKGRATAGTSIAAGDINTSLGYTPLSTTGKAADSFLLNGVTDAIAATANTIAKRDSSGNITANVFNGTATAARYADLAEKYTTDQEYLPGTVVVIAGPGSSSECTASYSIGQPAIGVVSTDPAYLMNSESEGQAIALVGRVPVRVMGPIIKGQRIMAGFDGRAVYGEVNPIGFALESNATFGEVIVECLIK